MICTIFMLAREGILYGKCGDYGDAAGAGALTDAAIIVVGGIGTALGFAINYDVQDKQMIKNKIQIEENVAYSANFAKFTGNAITVTRKDNKYYAEVFGVAIEDVGGTPTFASVSYEINKDLYDKVFKYMDIKYEYGKEGQLISATNEKRNPDFWFGRYKSNRAYWRIFEALVEVTEQEVVSKTFFGNANDVTSTTAKASEQGQFLVSGIGNVNIDNEFGKVSFTIDFIDATKDSNLTAKRLVVVQDLTDEIKNNPLEAYKNYTYNLDKCEIKEIEVGKIEWSELDYLGDLEYTF